MDGYLTRPLVFLIDTAFYIYILLVMLRFLLQSVRADFYNPISQFLVRATAPLLRPLRRLIPGLWGIDLASLVLLLALQSIAILLVNLLTGYPANPGYLLVAATAELINLTINIFMFTLIVAAILSWFATGGYHPAMGLLHNLNEPMLRRIRRLLPPAGGLDFTPVVAIIGLQLLKMLLIPPLGQLARSLL